MAPHPTAGVDAQLLPDVLTFVDCDTAVEWCEDRLLLAAEQPPAADGGVTLEAFDLLDGLSDAEIMPSTARVELRLYKPGTAVVPRGEYCTNAMFFLLAGRVGRPACHSPRGAANGAAGLATFGRGAAFREMAGSTKAALGGRRVRRPVLGCGVVPRTALDGLDVEHPAGAYRAAHEHREAARPPVRAPRTRSFARSLH